jgi:hypothetical protein
MGLRHDGLEVSVVRDTNPFDFKFSGVRMDEGGDWRWGLTLLDAKQVLPVTFGLIASLVTTTW